MKRKLHRTRKPTPLDITITARGRHPKSGGFTLVLELGTLRGGRDSVAEILLNMAAAVKGGFDLHGLGGSFVRNDGPMPAPWPAPKGKRK